MTPRAPRSAPRLRFELFTSVILLVILPASASRAQSAGNAVLEVPISVQVRSIDGKSAERMPGGGISRRTNRYEMEAGEREVEMRYHEIWPDNPNDDHEVAKSRWKNITIDARPGSAYRVTHPSLGSYKQARVFARDPEFLIETVEEDSVAISSIPVSAPAAHPIEESAEPEPETAAAADVAGAPADAAIEPIDSDVSPFELMQFWWKQANPTERKRFFEWIVEQE